MRFFEKLKLYALPVVMLASPGYVASGKTASIPAFEYPAGPQFTENKGQWHPNVLYRLKLNSGAIFFEKNRLTFHLANPHDLDEAFHHHGKPCKEDTVIIHGHAFYVHFQGAQAATTVSGKAAYPHYENYFIGNDPSRWAGGVRVYRDLLYQDIYPDIDLVYKSAEEHLKYSFLVKPGGDPSRIALTFEGVDSLWIQNNVLYYSTTVNTIREEGLYAYQEQGGKKIPIPCLFKLHARTVTFQFPQGYDPSLPLIIDPSLIFGTYTGSLADNFGYTATDDRQGNFYAGGIARGFGYPTTPGAFQTTYAGGIATGNFTDGYDADMAISKFNSTGTALLYSTYIGGSINDQPHSLVVNSNNELCVYGRTNSPDFPTTAGAYNRVLRGATDIVVLRLNQTGTALIGSTLVGGSAADGANITTQVYGANTSLKYNYADDARGEIIVDAQDNIYVASCTRSSDFPVTVGAVQTIIGGAQDACIFKLNSTLTTLLWSTFLGGSGDDAAYSLAFDSNGNIYTCGGTTSTNFPVSPTGVLHPTALGGRADGFLAHISTNGSNLLRATYIGTQAFDQCYFVQLDGDDNVYALGLTEGSFPISAGVYSNPNSGQFLISLPPDLSTMRFSTVFGRGDGTPDISPTAFLVDYCRRIFISGWGGQVNSGNNYGNTSTTLGLPVTSDAFQNTTDGSDFYFIVFDSDASSLRYATYFGGPLSAEHVDGGTSRFDKNGIIYQAVCAGCGGNSDFPSLPGVWSRNNPGPNCNLGAAKFEIEPDAISVSVTASPSTTGCAPFSVNFVGLSNEAKSYFWDFGDGSTSTQPFPTHTFTDTGTYTVTLIGSDSLSCDGYVFRDTATLTIIVRDDSVSAHFVPHIISNCDSFIVRFDNFSTNAATYIWDFGDGRGSSQISPVHQYTVPGTYTVSLIATNPAACNQSDTIKMQISLLGIVTAGISIPDTFGCAPFTAFFSAAPGFSRYFWDFGDGSSSTLSNPLHTYSDTGIYTVRLIVVDSVSCNFSDTATAIVRVTDTRVTADFGLDTLYWGCDSLVISFTNLSVGYGSVFWDFGDGSNSSLSDPIHTYSSSDSFFIQLIATGANTCNEADTTFKAIYLPPPVKAAFSGNDGCFPHDLILTSQSARATSLLWRLPGGTASSDSVVVLSGLMPGNYTVSLTAYNDQSCNDSSTVTQSFTVFNGPEAFFTTSDSVYDLEEPVYFVNGSTGGQAYLWDFGNGATSTEFNPVYAYPDTGTYFPCLYVSGTDSCDGVYCKKLLVEFLGVIDVPNAFSPNGDGVNDLLWPRGIGVSEIEFRIYNRWGELVFESTDADIVCNRLEECDASKGWDGTYKGRPQEMDVYVYTLKAGFQNGKKTELKKGNITLIR
ncbi:MAG: hypothetical protein KatS3mg031_1334 [Chitinophagales bacterium]|nr:MAG: hypothetical protein KatS3mg031_1334 [Chitinophagales bacterium]